MQRIIILFKRILLVQIFFWSFCSSTAQVNVKVIVKEMPATHATDTLFVAGNFNGWNPYDKKYLLKPVNERERIIELNVPAGIYEYKFTRGSWGNVETTKDGKDAGNRLLSLKKDTVITVSIGGWRDDFKSETIVRKHTASSNVRIIDTAFYIPQLNRTRRIWAYLPQGYSNSKKKYPVLYMHDGQNLFDEATSAYGEWGVDECLDSLTAQGYKECIVIGIDNGPRRMSEYNPYEFKPYGGGEGDKYIDFIALTLKPYIDKNYRTLKNKENTFVAGSSMGGLISLAAVMRYPKVFGGAGIFSPAFWTAPGLEKDVSNTAKKIKSKLFFYAGGSESTRMIPDMQKIEADIKALSSSKTYERVDMDARHNEPAWRKYFPEFYKWIMK